MPATSSARRAAAAGVALLVAAAGIGLAVLTFGGTAVERERPVAALRPRANGQIAIAQGPDADIILLAPETGASTTLVERHQDDNEGGLQMAWSPDGSKLAYTDYRNDAGLVGLFVLDLVSRQVLDVSAGLASADSPAWAPDGEAIAFTGCGCETGYDIYVVASDGTELRSVTNEADNGVDGAHFPVGMREPVAVVPAAESVPPAGIQPATRGLGNRCSEIRPTELRLPYSRRRSATPLRT